MDYERIIAQVQNELAEQRSLAAQDATVTESLRLALDGLYRAACRVEPESDGVEALAGLVVIVIGDNHCWGIAETLNEALANASKPAKYTAWLAKQGTTVSEFDGSLSWDKGYTPKLIGWKGVKKPAPMVAV